MHLHDKFTPRGIFAPRGKLMHINGALEYTVKNKGPIKSPFMSVMKNNKVYALVL